MKSEHYLIHHEQEIKHWWFQARRMILMKLIHKILSPDKESYILDLGCGTGGNAVELAKEYSVFGIDGSSEAIEFAKTYLSDAQFFHIEVIGENNKDLIRVLKKSKLVLLLDVLEHIENDKQVFANIIEHSNPKTYFLMTVPADMKLWSSHDLINQHFRRYDLDSYKDIWKDLSVKQHLLSHFNSRLYLFVRMVRIINNLQENDHQKPVSNIKKSNVLLNMLLRKIFSGESSVLLDLLDGKRKKGYSKGVSLVAVLEKI